MEGLVLLLEQSASRYNSETYCLVGSGSEDPTRDTVLLSRAGETPVSSAELTGDGPPRRPFWKRSPSGELGPESWGDRGAVGSRR